MLIALFVTSVSAHATKDPIQYSKKIEGYLVDYKTRNEVEKVKVSLTSLATGKVFTMRQMKMECLLSKTCRLEKTF